MNEENNNNQEVEISDQEFEQKLLSRKDFRDKIKDIEKTHAMDQFNVAPSQSSDKLSFKDKIKRIDGITFNSLKRIKNNQKEIKADLVSQAQATDTLTTGIKLETFEKVNKFKEAINNENKEQASTPAAKEESSPIVGDAEKKPSLDDLIKMSLKEPVFKNENQNIENVKPKIEEAVNLKSEIKFQPSAEPEMQTEIIAQNKEVEILKEAKIKTVEKNISHQADNRLLSIPAGASGELKFPDGFLWGTSTSAYQIEGNINNDWSQWEKSKKRISFLEKKGKQVNDFVSGQACDSWNRYKEDFILAKSLGTNAIRFGIEWARVETDNDVWDVKAIKQYREILHEAKKQGFKIALTMWHWTNPTWFVAEGGWTGKHALEYFDRYSRFLVHEFGTYVDYWVTLNEPMVHVFNGYLIGKFPPAKHNPFKAKKVFKNLIKAHKIAYHNIHDIFPHAEVSITGLINDFDPAHKWNLFDVFISKFFHRYWNHKFLSKIKKELDYVGLDYYFHDRIICYPPFKKNKNERTNDMGWEIYPEGIYHVLKYLKKFKKPIIIMENGLADENDVFRGAFIKEHLYWIFQALAEGIDVRGYFHWSLIDNFEWAAGYAPKFGLFAVDRKTLKRVPRPSAKVYEKICKENKLIL